MVYEKKTTIPNEQLDKLINYFNDNASKKETIKQVIYNYHTEGDFRLVRTNEYVKLDFKPSSAIEKENTVYITKNYDDDIIEIFKKIGMSIDFKRYRIRNKYLYDNLFITIDKYLKTGNILRVKFHYETDEELTIKKQLIDNLFNLLNIKETTLDKFQEIYGKYRSDWANLTKDINDDEFLK